MAPMHVRLKVALGGVVLAASVVSAQQAVRPDLSGVERPRPGVIKAARQNATAQKSARDIKSLINGVAVDSNQRPMPNAIVRLRNLETNAVEQIVTANAFGQFSFAVPPNVAYVVEIADQAGRVVAVGDVTMANAGEVAGAVVTLPWLPARGGVFGDTASSVISAATGIGLTVVDPTLPKVSPTR